MPETLRAWADAPDHIVVKLANTEHGFDLINANELLRDLQSAIYHAEMLLRHEKRLKGESDRNA